MQKMYSIKPVDPGSKLLIEKSFIYHKTYGRFIYRMSW